MLMTLGKLSWLASHKHTILIPNKIDTTNMYFANFSTTITFLGENIAYIYPGFKAIKHFFITNGEVK
jgi:hypothetical protein